MNHPSPSFRSSGTKAQGALPYQIHAADSSIAGVTRERVLQVRPKGTIPPDVLAYLKQNDFDHPSQVTLERITVVVDPSLPHDRSLYHSD